MQNKEHLTPDGFKKIVAIRASINNGLTDTLKAAFPDIIPVPRPKVGLRVVPDPNWLVGFVDGEGCYLIKVASCPKLKVQLHFQITQHIRDAELLESCVEYLGCGRYSKYSDDTQIGNFLVTKFADINEKIIPFFKKYPLQGVKLKDYKDFCKAADLMKNKAHLTVEGFNLICKIKYGMNTGREPIKCIKSYENAELFKGTILKENRNQSGIYRWVNNLNKKSYVGSGIDLAKRLGSYYNKNELNRNPRPIKDALVKYEHKNFTLDILEYCSKPELLEREQFYIDLLSPEYNILKFAYSMLGFRHSPENLEKFKLKIISPEHKEILSLVHKGKLVSQETRNKLAVATANYKKNNPLSPEALANIKAKSLEREGVSVTVLNTQTNEVREFTSQTEAGEFLGVTRQAIYNAIKRGKPIQGIYLISK